ncbi:MAG TPA: hypothetical protein PKI55_10830 [Chitinophagaceae bacterium]|nr:hypothetical protein [Chitinophagaceae bacterium]
MKRYTAAIFSIVLCFFLSGKAYSQQSAGASASTGLKELNIKFMLRGYFYAGSNIEDTTAPGGFGGSNNKPKLIVNETARMGDLKDISLLIDTTLHSNFAGEYKGYKLFLVNKSGNTISLQASDSRLYIIAEIYWGGTWQPIEYLPSSWCGNSYHRVFLGNNEYWEFDIPKYHGNRKTKLRYRLSRGKEGIIYSNEIITYFNKQQLTTKQGHKPQGIMDPYND